MYDMKIEGVIVIKQAHKGKKVLILPTESSDLNDEGVLEGLITDVMHKDKLVVVQTVKFPNTNQEQYIMYQVPATRLRWERKKIEHKKEIVESTSFVDEKADQGFDTTPAPRQQGLKRSSKIQHGEA